MFSTAAACETLWYSAAIAGALTASSRTLRGALSGISPLLTSDVHFFAAGLAAKGLCTGNPFTPLDEAVCAGAVAVAAAKAKDVIAPGVIM